MKPFLIFCFITLNSAAFTITKNSNVYIGTAAPIHSIALQRLSKEWTYSLHNLDSYNAGKIKGTQIILLEKKEDSL